MSLFKFLKNAGERVITGTVDLAEAINTHVANKLPAPDLRVQVQGERVVLQGTAKSQEEKEKLILAAGNVHGVAEVEDQITVVSSEPALEARFYTVQSGDTLSKIAKAELGKASAYVQIFEANRPLLSDPDKIYPGQVLRIPSAD